MNIVLMINSHIIKVVFYLKNEQGETNAVNQTLKRAEQ